VQPSVSIPERRRAQPASELPDERETKTTHYAEVPLFASPVVQNDDESRKCPNPNQKPPIQIALKLSKLLFGPLLRQLNALGESSIGSNRLSTFARINRRSIQLTTGQFRFERWAPKNPRAIPRFSLRSRHLRANLLRNTLTISKISFVAPDFDLVPILPYVR
jgi:hypothetical protein